MFAAPWLSVVLFVAASLLGALGQYLYKGAADASGNVMAALVSWRGLAGMACYVGVMVAFLAAFRSGGSVAVLYPIYATTFFWALLIGHFAYQEPISWFHVVGLLLLIAGIFLLGVRIDQPEL